MNVRETWNLWVKQKWNFIQVKNPTGDETLYCCCINTATCPPQDGFTEAEDVNEADLVSTGIINVRIKAQKEVEEEKEEEEESEEETEVNVRIVNNVILKIQISISLVFSE